MKEEVCRAFCAALDFQRVPDGYAVRTPYCNADGDPLLLYFIRDKSKPRQWRLEDDGLQIPLLEASGINLQTGRRSEAFAELLSEYGAAFDDNERTIRTALFEEGEAGIAAIKFLGLLLRLQDLALLDPRTVRTAFREDALAAIHLAFDHIAEVEESSAISEDFRGYDADVVIRAPMTPPLAVYFGTSEEKALQALVLKMEAEKYLAIASRVVLLLEKSKDNPLREPTYALAQARLDGVLSFRDAEQDAMQRLGQVFAAESRTIQ